MSLNFKLVFGASQFSAFNVCITASVYNECFRNGLQKSASLFIPALNPLNIHIKNQVVKPVFVLFEY